MIMKRKIKWVFQIALLYEFQGNFCFFSKTEKGGDLLNFKMDDIGVFLGREDRGGYFSHSLSQCDHEMDID